MNSMTAFRWTAGALMIVLVALLAQHKDREIQAEVWISRPPEDVWNVLTATAEYPSWNPFIRRMTGELRPGNSIEVEISPPGSSPMTFRPVIITVEGDRELRWLGSLWVRGLFDGEHSFRLESIGGRTHLIQAEGFSGILVGRLSDGIMRHTQTGFAAMNAALKARVESRCTENATSNGQGLTQ
jgi:hypothetical protein